jgi:hypothetical protein
MPLSLLIALRAGFLQNPRLVEETALRQLPWMCKGAKSAVMAEIDYDGFKLF